MKLTKIRIALLAVLGLVLAFAGGLYVGSGRVTKEVVEVKGEEKTVFKDRIVTVVKETRPDGTVKETTKTEDREGSTQSKSTQVASKTEAYNPDWKVGAIYHYQYGSRDQLSYMADVQATVSRRILGPVFVDVGVGVKAVSLGASVEF